MKCCLCGKEINNLGNNPYPLALDESERCCDKCNNDKVIPLRLFTHINKNKYALLFKEKEIEIVIPNKDKFDLKELQKYVNGYIEIAPQVLPDYYIIVNENGIIKNLYFNKLAYRFIGEKYVGNVLVCRKTLFE